MSARRIFAAPLLALALVAAPSIAAAGPSEEAFIRRAAERVTAAPNGSAIDGVIAEFVDYDRAARFALGRYARTVDAETFAEYRRAYEQNLRTSYREQLRSLPNAQIEVLGSQDRRAGDSIVRTVVRRPGEDDLIVNWRVLSGAGGPRVVDVQVFDVWLAIQQRADFAAVLDRNGGDVGALAAELRRSSTASRS